MDEWGFFVLAQGLAVVSDGRVKFTLVGVVVAIGLFTLAAHQLGELHKFIEFFQRLTGGY